jgi:methionyl-tRNA formyltransferase
MRYLIAANRAWYADFPERLRKRTGHEFILVTEKSALTRSFLDSLQPRYLFFPHWSSMVPAEIYESYESVIFHMTDLPFGRGGSPLQNLIARGIYETKVTALRCTGHIDAGPVYRKKPLSLYGTAEEIYLRAARIVEEMIVEIIDNEPVPVNQEGEAAVFERRTVEDGALHALSELEEVFDYIRMLDADGYPRAFLETEHLRLEFQRPSLKYGQILSDVIITKKR